MKFLFTCLFFAGTALANRNDLIHRPRSFSTPVGRAVFVDFETADYEISYDANLKYSEVVARIKFSAPESGLPIFDSVTPPVSVILDGETVLSTEVKTPSDETTLRVINKSIGTGLHTMTIKVPLTTLVEFSSEGIKSAFWTSDLSERNFLERYMPANLEFDQVKMTFTVSFEGLQTKQKIYTNGFIKEVKNSSKSVFKISYPDYFTASSIFFHTTPEGSTNELAFSVKSIDGREIPAIVYAKKPAWGGGSPLQSLKNRTTEIFQELESDYGAWPHPVLVVFNSGLGGMEYCGATMTSASALGHELFHSYFARGMMPANGNSGWLDEALASWRDKGYKSITSLSGTSKMSNHPYYMRTTDQAAYTFGERFMSYMEGKLQDKGGLKPFMRHIIEKRKFSPLFVEEFIKEMSSFYDVSVEADFKTYTYGSFNNFPQNFKSSDSHIHRKMTIEELKNHL
jgi:hypothetical protein